MGYQMVNSEMCSNLRPDNLESEIWMLGKSFHLGRKATMKAARWKRKIPILEINSASIVQS